MNNSHTIVLEASHNIQGPNRITSQRHLHLKRHQSAFGKYFTLQQSKPSNSSVLLLASKYYFQLLTRPSQEKLTQLFIQQHSIELLY